MFAIVEGERPWLRRPSTKSYTSRASDPCYDPHMASGARWVAHGVMSRFSIRGIAFVAVVAAALLIPSSALAANEWSAPTSIDPVANGTLTSVSCPTATFCVAVDNGNNNADGHALTFNDSTWSAPARMDPDGYGPVSVSCISTSFCATVDGSTISNGGGSALTFNGSSWSGPTGISNDSLTAVSCASSSFCQAVNGNAYA